MGIPSENLADAVKECLDEYMSLTNTEMKEAVKETADDVKRELMATSPKDTGAYSRSWTVNKIKETSNRLEVAIHSKKYQLTHLLEFGHASRNGGRVEGHPHIEPAQSNAEAALEAKIKKRLENIK